MFYGYFISYLSHPTKLATSSSRLPNVLGLIKEQLANLKGTSGYERIQTGVVFPSSLVSRKCFSQQGVEIVGPIVQWLVQLQTIT